MYIESWLIKFCELNPGATYEYIKDDDNRFVGCFFMLPPYNWVNHSFLGTFMIDCGFTVNASSYTFYI